MSTHSFGGYPPPDLPLSGERGCGDSRVAGGLYLEVPTSPFGKPVEHFLVCPPILPSFDIPTQGQMPFWKNGDLHLMDWVGEEYYPNVTDWIEEVRVLGVSTRVSIQLAEQFADSTKTQTVLEALTPDSRVWFAHARAFMHYPTDYAPLQFACPKDIEGHPAKAPTCVGIYWWDLDGGEPVDVPDDLVMPAADRLVRRTIPCGWSYLGRTRPKGVTPTYSGAVFARFPVIQLALVRGANGEHEPVLEKLSKLNLNIPVLEVDE